MKFLNKLRAKFPKKKIQFTIIILLSGILFYYSLKTFYFFFMQFLKKPTYPVKFIEDKTTNTITEHFQEDIWGRFIFYSDVNCGKCQKVKEDWNELFENKEDKECSKEVNGCRFNNKLIKFIIVDCNEEENSCYNIKSYPTFVLEIVKQNKVKEYKGVYNVQNMKQWLQDQTK